MSVPPCDRGFTDMMSHLVVYGAVRMMKGDKWKGTPPVPFDDLISSNNHLTELNKYFRRDRLLERNPEEIRQKLLRLRRRWHRVTELKIIETGLRNLPINPESKNIFFLPQEYALHVKVNLNSVTSIYIRRTIIVILSCA